MSMHPTLRVAVLLGIVVWPMTATAQVVPMDLGTLGGGNSVATAVNDHGQVVGQSELAGNAGTHAFSWTQAGGMIDLGTLGGSRSSAIAVNNNGQVIGWSDLTGGLVRHAFSWTQAGGMVDLGTLGGFSTTRESRATALNEVGHVVGQSFLPDGSAHPFLWTAADGMVDLGGLGGMFSEAVAVNVHDMVVGWSTLPGSFEPHAFRWTAVSGIVDLGTLGGSTALARAVNDAGQIVGESSPAINLAGVFSWTAAGGMVNIGTLGGDFTFLSSGANPFGVLNAGGQVVGSSYLPGNVVNHAFSWTATGGMIDLGTLPGTSFSQATAVSDAGRVIGVAGVPTRAFTWTHSGGMVELLTLAGYTNATAVAVNDQGQVAGTSRTPGPPGSPSPSRAVLWTLPTDTTPPQITAVVSGTQGLGGWYTSNITVAWIVSDAESPVSAQTGCDSVIVATDTAGMTLTCTATSAGGTSSKSVTVMRDATAPTVACAATPNSLWPPSGQLVDVQTDVIVGDALSGPAAFVLDSVSTSEGELAGDVVGWDVGVADTVGALRASRVGTSGGRIYTLSYVGGDVAGNRSTCRVAVLVPHDQRQ